SAAVQGGRLILGFVNGSQGSQIQDSVPAHFLPGPDQSHQQPEKGGLLPELDGRICNAGAEQCLIYRSFGSQQLQKYIGYHHKGNEVGQIRKGLDAAFEMLVAHLIDHQRQKQRQNTVGHNIHGTHGHGVTQNHAHIRVREKLLEVVKPYKLASQNPLGGTVAEKGHEPAVQGAIVKYSYQNHAGQCHEKQG